MWDKGNHLALVTMVQAAHGPDEDPPVEFDSPALNCMNERLSDLVYLSLLPN